jgi:hypothetical protein
MFIIAGWFLASYDYIKILKGHQEFTALTLTYEDVNKIAKWLL